jgi:hypothetical protein
LLQEIGGDVMRLLRSFKVPGLIALSVGSVWVAACSTAQPEPTTNQLMLPPTYAMKEMTAEIQQKAIQAGEYVADVNEPQ